MAVRIVCATAGIDLVLPPGESILDAVHDAGVLEEAEQPGRRLVGRLGLTDRHGQPRCASVRPPDVEWVAEASG